MLKRILLYSSLNAQIPFYQEPHVSHDPNAPGEVMTDHRLYDGLPEIILDYLDGDIAPIRSTPNNEAKEAQYNHFKLFGRSLENIAGGEFSAIANCILRGEQRDFDYVLDLVKRRPFILHIKAEGTDL